MKDELQLWELIEDYGRMGEIYLVFSATKADIEKVIGKSVYWDDELGKHSEGEIELSWDNIKPFVPREVGWSPIERLYEYDEIELDEDGGVAKVK